MLYFKGLVLYFTFPVVKGIENHTNPEGRDLKCVEERGQRCKLAGKCMTWHMPGEHCLAMNVVLRCTPEF